MAITPIPNVYATADLIPVADDFQISPPLLWHTFADQWGPEFNTGIASGLQKKHIGQITATAQLKPQNTYIFGDGTVFASVGGRAS